MIVSLDYVKQALRIAEWDDESPPSIADHEDDALLTGYIAAAQEAVLRYLKDAADPEWLEYDGDWDADDDERPPLAVRQAIILAVQGFYDPDQHELLSGLGTSDPKNPIVALLCMMRDPTVA